MKTCTHCKSATQNHQCMQQQKQSYKEAEKNVDNVFYFLRFGRSLLTQRRRHDFPVRRNKPLDRMELQSLGPYLLTWLIKTSSSSAFHGPFLISLSPLLITLLIFLLLILLCSVFSTMLLCDSFFLSFFILKWVLVVWVCLCMYCHYLYPVNVDVCGHVSNPLHFSIFVGEFIPRSPVTATAVTAAPTLLDCSVSVCCSGLILLATQGSFTL